MLRRTFAMGVGLLVFAVLAGVVSEVTRLEAWAPPSIALGAASVGCYVALAIAAGFVAGLIAPARRPLDWTAMPLMLALVGLGALLLGISAIVLADNPAEVRWPWWPTATLMLIAPALSYGWHLRWEPARNERRQALGLHP